MDKKSKKVKHPDPDEQFPLPIYNSEDDIYRRMKEVRLDNVIDDEEGLGNDLDVPGSELDDANEKIVEEDEENNYYSLGGDDHVDLEEDRQ